MLSTSDFNMNHISLLFKDNENKKQYVMTAQTDQSIKAVEVVRLFLFRCLGWVQLIFREEYKILHKYSFQFLPRTINRPTVGNTTDIMGKVNVLSKEVSNMGRTTMPQYQMARIINMITLWVKTKFIQH